MKSEHSTAIVIDDDPEVRELVARIGEKCGVTIVQVESADRLPALYQSSNATLYLVDLMLGERDALDVLSFLAKQGCRSPVVLMTGYNKFYMDTTEKSVEQSGLNIVAKIEKRHLPEELQALLSSFAAPAAQ